MAEPTARPVERVVFGVESAAEVRARIARHLRERLGVGVDDILFQSGAIGAVLGLRLSDGREAVLKALRRSAADAETELARLRAVVAAQNQLAAAGFGCARVLDGPSTTAGVTAIVEERLHLGSAGNPHNPESRAAMAWGLARQVGLLRGVDGSALNPGRPAWADWDGGAWPTPHDPIFDFSPVSGYEWIDADAEAASVVLRQAGSLPPVIAHSDWVWQNVCLHGSDFLAGYDWDSLVYLPESAVVGLVAASFSQGSADPPDAPTSDEVRLFVEDYQRAAERLFDPFELDVAAAAAVWVRSYNARCQLHNKDRRGIHPPPGSFVEQLEADRRAVVGTPHRGGTHADQ